MCYCSLYLFYFEVVNNFIFIYHFSTRELYVLDSYKSNLQIYVILSMYCFSGSILKGLKTWLWSFVYSACKKQTIPSLYQTLKLHQCEEYKISPEISILVSVFWVLSRTEINFWIKKLDRSLQVYHYLESLLSELGWSRGCSVQSWFTMQQYFLCSRWKEEIMSNKNILSIKYYLGLLSGS